MEARAQWEAVELHNAGAASCTVQVSDASFTALQLRELGVRGLRYTPPVPPRKGKVRVVTMLPVSLTTSPNAPHAAACHRQPTQRMGYIGGLLHTGCFLC